MKTFLKILSSTRITGFCLLWLFVLTFWGTIAQVSHGLYAAQERYFYSYFFKIFWGIPLLGAQGTLWILFVNLCASSITHLSKLKTWRSIGLKLSHFGVFLFFIAAFVTFHMTEESNVHLMEGESTNVGTSYNEWEIASWRDGAREKVSAVDLKGLKTGSLISLNGVDIVVEKIYLNSSAYASDGHQSIVNGSGIGFLKQEAVDKDREKNVAGGIFRIDRYQVLLYGDENKFTKVGDRYFHLRHKKFPLPFTLKLKKFKAEFHPGTNIASSYESLVEIIKENSTRDVRIYMNNPLREREYTFYQASYSVDRKGNQYSTLAVVKNAGQVLPYIASFVVFFGLAIHFILVALARKQS